MKTAARMNLKYLVLSQGGQTQKATYYIIPFTWHSARGKLLGTENRSVAANSWDSGLGER